jgi:hypothetical protein
MKRAALLAIASTSARVEAGVLWQLPYAASATAPTNVAAPRGRSGKHRDLRYMQISPGTNPGAYYVYYEAGSGSNDIAAVDRPFVVIP